MSITLTTNYKETLSPEIVAIVNDLVENDYELSDVLDTLDYFGEEYQDHLEQIIECRDDNGVDNSDLWDYIEKFSVNDLEYFSDYRDAVENYNEDAVNAYVDCCGIESVASFEESYEGEFDRVEDFVEYILESTGEQVPSWLCIDAETTWRCSLCHDYFEENDFYFRSI